MANFDETYKQVYYQTMYPPAEQPSATPGLWVPPEDRAEENAMRQANMALSGMAMADTAAGMLKGAAAGAVGTPGEILGIGRGLVQAIAMGAYGIATRGLTAEAGAMALDSFLDGMEKGFIAPTTSDVSKWLDENVGPVVPPGGELDQVQKFREQKAETGEMVGEFLAPGGVVGAVAKGGRAATEAVGRGVKAVGEKAAEMAEDFLTDRGLLLRFGPENKQVEIPAAPRLETPEFQNWFSDSKVLDDQGNPLVMYHGTRKSENGEAFTIFDTYSSQYGLFGQGSYFTADPNVASSYTKKGKGESPTVYPVYLSIKNPIDMDAKANPNEWKRIFPDADEYHDGGESNESWFRAVEEFYEREMVPDYEAAEAIQGGLTEMGYDGITHIGGGRATQSDVRHRVYIAFEPEQVKSVFNKGTWNPNDPRISYGVGAGGAGAATQMEQE